MIPQRVRLGLIGATAAFLATQSVADDQTDRAVRQRKLEAYAADVVAQHPAQKAYFILNKTPRDQGLADEVYSALRKSGKAALVYETFYPGDITEIQTKDWPLVEQADVLFCGCTTPESNAVKATVAKQGFTGQFVVLSEPK